MSRTSEERYMELMDLLQVDSKYIEPTLENLRWFIRIGYGHKQDNSSAIAALDLAYCLQTKCITNKPNKHRGAWGDTDADLQNVLKR